MSKTMTLEEVVAEYLDARAELDAAQAEYARVFFKWLVALRQTYAAYAKEKK